MYFATMSIQISSSASSSFKIKKGVPQGAVLGPRPNLNPSLLPSHSLFPFI